MVTKENVPQKFADLKIPHGYNTGLPIFIGKHPVTHETHSLGFNEELNACISIRTIKNGEITQEVGREPITESRIMTLLEAQMNMGFLPPGRHYDQIRIATSVDVAEFRRLRASL